ncbi:MAG: hypothetical protein U0166_24560 [Acidobacteriota bacterium]
MRGRSFAIIASSSSTAPLAFFIAIENSPALGERRCDRSRMFFDLGQDISTFRS